MADLVIPSIRGMNNTDPPTSLPDDQCTLARNVEFHRSTCGERRRGSEAFFSVVTPSFQQEVPFLARYLPTDDESACELIAYVLLGNPGILQEIAFWRRSSVSSGWSQVSDGAGAVHIDGGVTSQYRFQMSAVSLHGKLFVAYKSSKDRLHVIDGPELDGGLRLTGLAEPAAPTAGNQGSGSLVGPRYYRVRYTRQDTGVTILRSEPSETLTFTPSGSGAAVRVTKPAAITEGETHWELEASIDNANFYRIATTAIGTTTYDDSQDYSAGYAAIGTLSETVGDYLTPWSAKYLAVDQDRLLMAGSFEDPALASRVAWTPVAKDPGVGNDERIPLDSDNYLDLDGQDGGGVTGLSSTINGYTYVFKWGHIYKLVRSGVRTRAYDAFVITKELGAIPRSVVAAFDAVGNPVIFFLDPRVGPCMIGADGRPRRCGADIFETWQTVNLDAADFIARGVYYPEPRQVHWWVATGDSDRVDTRLVLQTNLLRETRDGLRYGWAIWDGPSASILDVCLFAEDVDVDGPFSRVLRPIIAVDEFTDPIWRTDTGDDDNGEDYAARVVTKPYILSRVLHKFGVMSAAVVGKAVEGAQTLLKAVRDFGLETNQATVDYSPAGSEDQVVRFVDDLKMSEARAMQFEITDTATPTTRWEVNQISLRLREEQKA